ncbi:ionotropic receptor 40a isoform X2 [Diabrotica virgifera virgifera]|uniref:Ionotropic glutamate receptor L-glutamate and glycine-binding domain-containing protein n=1 Tax=Diabrotica virgifera virgifera TaxID=50390 RepID=A0ABM5JQA6_DIAVI|nr:ionotropic receptor 40a isoform X2 [Diabrotica virgifera virgifera]
MTFNFSNPDIVEKYFSYLSHQTENFYESSTLFLGRHRIYEYLLIEIYERNLIRRNTIFIFYWGKPPFTRYFTRNIPYSIKAYAITNPRNNTYRLYYSQATSHKQHHLEMVNWWNQDMGIFHHPTLPITKSVFKDFKGRVLRVPVLHKPPWHFVRYTPTDTNNQSAESTIQVLGGRDDRILKLLSKKLNFRFDYFDPPERIEGTSNIETGYFSGVIGQILRKEADLFIGDVGLTYERFKHVEFSFITLADSGAFVTHAPSQLNEALALLRPFQWQNGTGIYSRLYNLMILRQGNNDILVDSVEMGVKMVRDSRNVAVMGGRETLFFDIQRFGPVNFHLSEKLNTAYSAIALQLGCPFVEEINKILRAIFEAGIITKMTENEYEKLGKEKSLSSYEIAENVAKDTNKDLKRQSKAEEEHDKLKPISLKMLQGNFYLLCFGNVFSGLVLVGEILFYKRRLKNKSKRKKRSFIISKWKKIITFKIRKYRLVLRRFYMNAMHDAFVSTLEYVE